MKVQSERKKFVSIFLYAHVVGCWVISSTWHCVFKEKTSCIYF